MAPRLPPTDAEMAREAMALLGQGRHKPAERLLKDVLRRTPDQFDALLGLGVLSGMRGEDGLAAKHLKRAVQKKPASPDAQYNLGQALIRLGRTAEAADALEAAAASADEPHIHEKLGDCRRQLGALEAAVRHYRRAVELADRRAGGMLLSSLVETQRRLCDWSSIDALEAQLLACAARGDPVEPLLLHYIADDPSIAKRNAVAYATTFLPADAAGPRYRHAPRDRQRLRIGYLCSDFRRHATAHLMAELFEGHDRSQFETFALSFGPPDKGPMRRRLEAAFDHFVDLARHSDADIAKRINALGIDILIDLNGYIANARPGILLARPAPIQVHYLAFPGTLGSTAIDYMLVDTVIAPPGADQHYTEKLVRLPDCYQPNDRKREIAAPAPSRSACGLPEDGTVFASFNNPIKISPPIFAAWMAVLAATPGSVLWLYADNTAAPENLGAAAVAAGMAPDRLVFAAYTEPAEHLARLANADLVLDCFPYGAHTTASDALWMGVPVLTREGKSFASRVGASLLRAVGLPELITANAEDYERLAIDLGRTPARLADLRARLARGRDTAPLFDTPRLARHVEAAYSRMWQRWQSRELPAAFDVSGDLTN